MISFLSNVKSLLQATLGASLFWIGVLLASSLQPSKAYGLEKLADKHSLTFSTLSLAEGLSQPAVVSITQDSDGYIWVGTQHGVNYYDGYAFNQIANDGRNVSSLYFDSISQKLFYGSSEGLHEIKLPSRNTVVTKTFEEPVTSIGMDQHNLLVGTNKGIYREHDSGRWSKINPFSKSITKIHLDELGTTWIGTTEGLYILDKDQTTNVLAGINVSDIASKDGTIYIAALDSGSLVLDRNKTVKLRYKHGNGGLSGTESRAILISRYGDLWIGTDQGVSILSSRHDPKHIPHSSNEPDSLSHPYVTSLLEDTGGNIWIGTYNGLSKSTANSNNFSLYSSASGDNFQLVNNTVLSFHQTETNELWVGTSGGLSHWVPGNDYFTSFPSKSLDLTGVAFFSIFELEESLIIGSVRGTLHEINPIEKRNTLSPSVVVGSTITKVVEHGDSLLIGTFGSGLLKVNLRHDRMLPTEYSPLLKGAQVVDLVKDSKNHFWVATFNRGLFKLTDLETIEIKLTSQNTLPVDSLTSLALSSSGLWIGTNNQGLVYYDYASEHQKFFNVESGLPSNLIYSVEVDDLGAVWMATPKGLSRLNPSTKTVKSFNSNHGLQADDFNSGASLKLSDGTLLFGGNNGFNAFDPAKIKLNDHKAQTLITSFSKMNKPQPGRFASDGTETLKLSHKENVFSFEFALMDFASPKDNTFEYQLEGFDDGWVNSGTRNTVSYTNLDPGGYTFKVRGLNNDGLATDKIASVHLNIAPPPWLTWYAYLLYFAILLLLSIFAFRAYTAHVIRLTNEKRNREERERLEALVAERTEALNEKIKEQASTLRQKELANKEIHHRVKNNLQVILGLLTLQAETEENELFRSAMNVIRQRITSMSLIHKSLYEHSVATIDIKQYAENLVASIRQFHPEVANGSVEVILDIEKETLDIDTALPIGLILNELITNCLKHGFSNSTTEEALKVIHIEFKRLGENFLLTVTDNGKGLPAEFDVNSPASMGSELILIFAQQVQGKLTAGNAPGGGASFSLSFPIPANPEPHQASVEASETE